MKRLIAAWIGFALIINTSAQALDGTITYNPYSGPNTPVTEYIAISASVSGIIAWIQNLFTVQQSAGSAVDSVLHGLTYQNLVPTISPGTLVNIQEIIRSAMPDLPVKDIKSFTDLRNVQNQIVPEMPAITEKYFRTLMEKYGQDLRSLKDGGKLTMPNIQNSALAAGNPKFLDRQELLKKVNEKLQEKGHPNLNLEKHGTDIQAMTGVYRIVEQREREIFDPYLRDQRQFNGTMARQGLKTVADSVGELKTSQLEQQSLPENPQYQDTTINNTNSPPSEPSLLPTYRRLVGSDPVSPQGRMAREAGLLSVNAADYAYSQGQTESGNFHHETAKAMADIALGFVPVVGTAKDIFESVTGHSLLDGRKLTDSERALALFGVVTVGLAPSAIKAAKFISTIARDSAAVSRAARVAGALSTALQRGGLQVAESVPPLRRFLHAHPGADAAKVINDVNGEILERADALGLKLTDRRIKFTDDVNEAYLNAHPNHFIPHQPDRLIIEGTATDSKNLVRAFNSETRRTSSIYLVDRRTIEGLDSVKIKKRLNIPGPPPDMIADVRITAPTRVSVSPLAAIDDGFETGHLQIIVNNPEDLLSKVIFEDIRKIGE